MLNFSSRLERTPLASAHYFSSISADVGNPGQANYAAANAALTAITQRSAVKVTIYIQTPGMTVNTLHRFYF